MKLTRCRVCKGSNLINYLNLGFTPAADAFVKFENRNKEDPLYPLEVCFCDKCGISQLNYTVDPKILYQNDYPYESSTTNTGRLHFDKFASNVFSTENLGTDDLVVDIGSNVGVLLGAYKKRGCKVLGIEPSTHIAEIANNNGINTINDFISIDLAKEISLNKGKASVINITNVFAHINDLYELMFSVDHLLDKKGQFIIEAPHFLTLVNGLEYDTIYHEHLLYLSVKPLKILFDYFNFEIFDVQEVNIHGGSIRVFVCRKGQKSITDNVNLIIRKEEEADLFDLSRLKVFSNDVHKHKLRLRNLLINLKKDGKRIAAVSAPAKGMTLLNYCNIDSKILDFVTEKSLLKIGKYTPGSHIPIYPDQKILEGNIDYALLLAWNFADEIMLNLSDFKKTGGKFIVPIPDPKIL